MRIAVLAPLALLACAIAIVPATAQDGELLNQPSANWNVYGPGQTHEGRTDKDVQGGGAIRVTIPAKPANVWDVGASTQISGPIRKGDTLMFAFWVRLVSEEPTARGKVAASIQQSKAPYGPIVGGELSFGTEWTLVQISGVANADYAPGDANAALSLGTAAQTVDLGPAFVMTVKQVLSRI